MSDVDPTADAQPMTGQTIKKRAARGAILVGGRTLAIRILGLVGNLFLARMLSPEQFGILAVGVVILTLSAIIGNGGFGAALVRGEAEPTRRDLETMTGFQLWVGLAAVAIVLVLAQFVGTTAYVALVMMFSVPIAGFKAPHAMILERHLNYPPLVRAEIAEVVVLQVMSVLLVFFGAGVWGVAIAMVLQAITGAILLTASTSAGVVAPRLHWLNLKAMAPFGVKVQLMLATSIGLVQGLNIVVGAFGGLYALGLWSFAARLIQPAQQVFETLRFVSYPTMARLRDAGEDLSSMFGDALRLLSVASGFLLVPIAASTPALITFAFGPVWEPSSDIVSLVLISLLVTGPVTTAFLGLLLTFDHAGVALRGGIVQAVVWLLVTTATYPVFGVTSVGVGALVVAPALLLFYGIYAPNKTGLRFAVRPVLLPAGVAILAVGVGRLIEGRLHLASGLEFLACASASVLFYGVLVVLLLRPTVSSLWGMVRQLRGGSSEPSESPAAAQPA